MRDPKRGRKRSRFYSQAPPRRGDQPLRRTVSCVVPNVLTLADGVFQTMTLQALKTFAVFSLLVGPASILLADEAPPVAAAEEVKETVLPIDRAVVRHLQNFGGMMRDLLATPGGIVAVSAVPPDDGFAAGLFLAARDQALRSGRQKVKFELGGNLLVAGPVLNSPDKVSVRKLIRRGDALELEIEYTDVALDGAELRRNLPWVPLVQVPLELPPGTYAVKAVWKKVPSGQGDKPRDVAPRSDSCAVEMVAGLITESKPIEAADIRFQAVADCEWLVPESDRSTTLDLGLRLSNPTRQSYQFALTAGLLLEIRTIDDTKLASDGGTSPLETPPLVVPAGRAGYLFGRATLGWDDKGEALQLNWQDGTGGFYHVRGLKPGRYVLRFRFENARPAPEKSELVWWLGNAYTKDAIFEVKTVPLRAAPEARLKATWEALGDSNVARSQWAVWTLAGSPKEALSLLSERLQRATERVDVAGFQRLVARLGDDEFQVREQAADDLEKLGDLVVPLIRKALAPPPADPEIRHRLEKLLERLEEKGFTTTRRRHLRALDVLEQIHTLQARELVERLADGTPEDPVTMRARESLKRMDKP